MAVAMVAEVVACAVAAAVAPAGAVAFGGHGLRETRSLVPQRAALVGVTAVAPEPHRQRQREEMLRGKDVERVLLAEGAIPAVAGTGKAAAAAARGSRR